MVKRIAIIGKRQREARGGEGKSSPASKLLLVASIIILFLTSLASSPATASAAFFKASQTASNNDSSALLLVRVDFCYGIILTKSNSSRSEDTVRFTFTYNFSLQNGERLHLYAYTTDGTLRAPTDGIQANLDSGGFYTISKLGSSVCRLYDTGVETEFGTDYARITIATRETSDSGEVTWSSGYNVGTGVAAQVNVGGGSLGGVGSGVLDVATAVALTLTSLVPFFMLLPEATKKLCQAVANGGGELNGLSLYVKILAVFTPLLCIGMTLLSVTAMLNTLTLGSV